MTDPDALIRTIARHEFPDPRLLPPERTPTRIRIRDSSSADRAASADGATRATPPAT